MSGPSHSQTLRLPLITHADPGSVLAYRAGRAISAAGFLHDVRALARALPGSTHLLNLCTNRYRFTVALAAGWLRGQCSLLPSTHTPEMLRRMHAFAPDLCCLSDDARNDLPAEGADRPLSLLRYPPLPSERGEQPDPAAWSVPMLPAELLAAYVFTSGSTGVPVPHPKTIGALLPCVRAEAKRLPLIGSGGCALLATVPAQHMYGFESSVLLPLQSGSALCAERPFYPADICEALQRLPRPRALLTAPVHLRALLAAGTPPVAVDLIVSATALLPAQLARAAERAFGAPLLEIYGSTETGQIASRRTADEDEWRLWPDVRLRVDGERCIIEGGHVARPTEMPDILESTGPDRFRLHGRSADLVNIAGKRSSLAYLNHQLNAVPGVLDGAYFFDEDASRGLPAGRVLGEGPRLAAAVVAPRLTDEQILVALRERIDPIFLPRRLLRVDQLPRNATGKLPHQALRALAARGSAGP